MLYIEKYEHDGAITKRGLIRWRTLCTTYRCGHCGGVLVDRYDHVYCHHCKRRPKKIVYYTEARPAQEERIAFEEALKEAGLKGGKKNERNA